MTGELHSRRQLLAALGAGGVLAGCLDSDSSSSPTETPEANESGSTQRPSATDSGPTGEYQITEFVERDGSDLVLNGTEYRYNGLASLLTMTIPQLGERWVDRVMSVAASADVNVIRCWGFPPTFDPTAGSVHPSPGTFDDEWFELFDYTVARAKEAGVRLVVPLLQGVHVDASNDARNYAPSPATYGTWSDTADYTRYPKDFIEDEQANDYFKEYVEHLLTRENRYTGVEYRKEPTILVWECANELEFHHPDRAGETLDFWYDDVGSYIKSLGAEQLVGTGMHGSMGAVFEPWTRRCDFVQDHQAEAIDVCSFHHYPVSGRPGTELRVRSPELSRRYVTHKTVLAHEQIGKPVYCGEFGAYYVASSVQSALVTRLETPEEASDVESNADYPMAYPDQHEDGVLVTRDDRLDWDTYGLEKRHEYFGHATDAASETGLDGMHWWRLNPARIPDDVSEGDRPAYRMRETGYAILTEDRETFDVIATYFDRNASNTDAHKGES